MIFAELILLHHMPVEVKCLIYIPGNNISKLNAFLSNWVCGLVFMNGKFMVEFGRSTVMLLDHHEATICMKL
jgi:hypothetical protein